MTPVSLIPHHLASLWKSSVDAVVFASHVELILVIPYFMLRFLIFPMLRFALACSSVEMLRLDLRNFQRVRWRFACRSSQECPRDVNARLLGICDCERGMAKSVLVFAAGAGSQVIRRVELAQAEHMEAAGAWRREYDTLSGRLLGFRLISVEARKVDSDIRTRPSTAGITKSEMERNALARRRPLGALGRSMPGRENRAESVVARTQAKVIVYPLVGAAAGDILRVWPR